MKRTLISLALVAALAIPAAAQVPSPFSIYAGGLMSMPQGPEGFNEGYKNGWHGFAGVGLSAVPKLQVLGKLEYNTFGVDFGSDDTYSGGNINMLMFGVDGRLGFGAPAVPFKPFGFIGLGLANVSFGDFEGPSGPTLDALNASQPESQTKLYWNLGAGVEFKATPVTSFFVQARYVSVTTEGDALGFIPISLGLKFF